MFRTHQPDVSFMHTLTLDFDLDSTIELPLVWLTGSLFSLIWKQREEGRVSVARTRAELEAKCCLLWEGKVKPLLNAYALTDISLKTIFKEN